jgi:hypothetical protein
MNNKNIINTGSISNLFFTSVFSLLFVGITFFIIDKRIKYNNKIDLQQSSDFIYDKDIQIDKDYLKKIKKIIIKKSCLDKDPYNRTIGNDIVKLFSAIAIHHGIKINDIIDDKTFDALYLELVKYQIKMHQITSKLVD